ncbi:MAG: GNAT family N-acetyltransferase [Lewinellaceae bacterium]|nr:GNAT family N-acetyltransferase [Lewinellaceae bacterium]
MTKQIKYLPITFGRDMENQEISYFSEHYRALPRGVATRLGVAAHTLGQGTALIVSDVDVLAFNRVIGLGLDAPATEAQLDELTGLYEAAGTSRFFIQLSKIAERPALLHLLEAKGFSHYNNWAKLYRRVQPLPEIQTGLRAATIGAGSRDTFADVILRSFQWPEALRPLLANPVGRPGWKHYLAYDGQEPVAAAALFMRGKLASLAFAATLPEYRGRGVQQALIARRLRDAYEAGCRWAVAETAEDRPERPAASYRNMRRMGFELAYLRPNYLRT